MTISVINAVAEFERDLLIERTHADLIQAKEQGKVLVCPVKLTAEQKRIVGEGASISAFTRELVVDGLTIPRARDSAKGSSAKDP